MAEAPGFHRTPPCWPSPHKPDSVSRRPHGRHAMIIYLSGRATGPPRLAATARLLPGVIHPLRDLRPGGPFLLFCLAPHEVCRAPFLTVGAVGSYPAFSPLPPLARRRFDFCDTVCERGLHRAPHACAWHAALWCPDFPLALFLAVQSERSLRLDRSQTSGKHARRQRLTPRPSCSSSFSPPWAPPAAAGPFDAPPTPRSPFSRDCRDIGKCRKWPRCPFRADLAPL